MQTSASLRSLQNTPQANISECLVACWRRCTGRLRLRACHLQAAIFAESCRCQQGHAGVRNSSIVITAVKLRAAHQELRLSQTVCRSKDPMRSSLL